MTPEQIEQMEAPLDPETHADGFTPMWGYVVAWEKYKEAAAHIIAQREQIAALEKRVKAADELAKSVDDLIAHSDGVSGLHNNGDIAPWSDLEKGGAFGAWLSALEDYRATGGQDNE